MTPNQGTGVFQNAYFIYTDEVCVIAKYQFFTQVDRTIEEALIKLSGYYNTNSVRANPDKTQVTAIHLKNKEAKRLLKVEWNRIEQENTTNKYLCIILDQILNYKEYLHRVCV